MIDIRENKEALDALNAILSNKGIAEIKDESRNGEPPNLVVVEVSRSVKTKKHLVKPPKTK